MYLVHLILAVLGAFMPIGFHGLAVAASSFSTGNGISTHGRHGHVVRANHSAETGAGCCFSHTCIDWELTGDGHTLQATCYHIFDPRHWFNVDSHLDLNLCIGYQGGNLIPGNHYTESCAQCFLIDTFLQCGCGGPSPAAHKSGINLDEFIENSHGVLKCFGNTGIDDDRVPHTANVTATANTTCAGDNASFCPNIDVHEG